MTDVEARRRHYGRFYRLHHEPSDGRRTGLVVGNCQAESLRVALGEELDLVRLPPVHELEADDLPHLQHWLERSEVLITQPVHADYHDLPLGSDQLAAALPDGALVCRVPVVRFAGLYPFHVIVRPPSDPSLVPPLVAYHDVRLLAEAAGHRAPGTISPAQVLAVAAESLDQLRRRERAHGTVVISDVFARPRFALMRTLNHPGNPVFEALAERVGEIVGLTSSPPEVERELLTSVRAPREHVVAEAWSLDDEPTEDWTVDGVVVGADEVREAHLAWYAAHPDAVSAGLARHAAVLELLGAR